MRSEISRGTFEKEGKDLEEDSAEAKDIGFLGIVARPRVGMAVKLWGRGDAG